MKKHNGMRSLDIVVLLKIIAKQNNDWFIKDLAYELGISQSEVSESLNRSMIASLLKQNKKSVVKRALYEFLRYGISYVYPQLPGSIVRGIATAHSAPPLNRIIQSEGAFVWPYVNGNIRGQSIEPLHKSVPIAIQNDNKLYELLALVDSIRVGRKREIAIALKELQSRIL